MTKPLVMSLRLEGSDQEEHSSVWRYRTSGRGEPQAKF